MATELLNIRLTADGARARSELNRTEKSVGGLGDALKTAAKLGIGFGSGMEVARAAIGALKSAVMSVPREIARLIEETSLYGDAIAKQSRALGVGAADLQALGFAASRGGASQEILAKGLKSLARVMDDARSGSKDAAEVFTRLGVAVVDASGQLRPTAAVFRDVADAIQRQGEGAQTAADLNTLLGRAGTEMGSLMLAGSEGLDAMARRFEELGGIMSGEALTAAEVYRDALDDLDAATKGLERTLAGDLMPAMIGLRVVQTQSTVMTREMIDRAREWVGTLREQVGLTDEWVEGLSLGIPVIGGWAAAMQRLSRIGGEEVTRALLEQRDATKAARQAALEDAVTREQEARAMAAEAEAHKAAERAAKGHEDAIRALVASRRSAMEEAARELEQLRGAVEFLGLSGAEGIFARAAAEQALLTSAWREGILTLDEYLARYERVGQAAQTAIDQMNAASALALQEEHLRRAAEAAREYQQALSWVGAGLNAIGGFARAVGDIVVSQHERGSEAAKREAKTAFVVTQAVALASAIVSTAAAVAGALANPPFPPYSIPQAVAAGILGGIEVATIAATTIAGVADAGLTPEQINRAVTGSHSTVVVQRGEAVIDRRGTSEISSMLALQRERMAGGGGATRVQIDAPVMLDGRQVGRFVDDHLVDTTERGRAYSTRVQPGTA